jgi:hypothetical protein
MKTEFIHNQTRYVPGQTFGREQSRGYGQTIQNRTQKHDHNY